MSVLGYLDTLLIYTNSLWQCLLSRDCVGGAGTVSFLVNKLKFQLHPSQLLTWMELCRGWQGSRYFHSRSHISLTSLPSEANPILTSWLGYSGSPAGPWWPNAYRGFSTTSFGRNFGGSSSEGWLLLASSCPHIFLRSLLHKLGLSKVLL